MNKKFRRIIALSLVLVITCLSINSIFSVAHMIEEAGFASPHNILITFLDIETSGHCPSCPADDHPSSDHDHFSCDHHTYISFADQAVYRHPAQATLAHVNHETIQFIPEVYLDIATPPHILA